MPPAQALWPHPSLSVVPQGAQAAWRLATSDGQKDPVGNISPIPDLRNFSNFSRLGRRTDDTQTTPPFLTSSKRPAYKIPPPLPPHPGREAPTLCRTVGWSGADLAPSSPLGGQPGERSTTMATTDRDTEAQRGSGTHPRPHSTWEVSVSLCAAPGGWPPGHFHGADRRLRLGEQGPLSREAGPGGAWEAGHQGGQDMAPQWQPGPGGGRAS